MKIIFLFPAWVKAKKLLNRLRNGIQKGDFSQIIAIDPHGLCLTKQILPSKSTIVLNYCSFEILFTSEILKVWQRDLFNNSNEMSERVDRILVQDNERRDSLIEQSSFKTKEIHLVPVAPEINGPKKTITPQVQLSKESLPKMVLYCGNIENWNIKNNLDELIVNLPVDFYLRIHTHFPLERRTRAAIKEFEKSGTVKFSQGFMEEKEHLELIQKAFVGLAPYFPQKGSWMTGKNIYHLGLSSSKISYFCALGIPVLTSSLPSLKNYNDIYKFGELFTDWGQIHQKIRTIEQNHVEYSKNARTFYEQALYPKHSLDNFCKNLY
jgi:hypothetical protein